MLNYVVDPRLIMPLVPAKTEIDFENGETFLSVVGFLFLDTRLLGLPIPLHRDFEEVNLRFYVRRKSEDIWQRGVVFIRELVPRRAIALVARTFYGEFPLGRFTTAIQSGVVLSARGKAARLGTLGRPPRIA